MKTYNISCVVTGGDKEDHHHESYVCSFIIPDDSINKNSIDQYFPFQGIFHYRLKVSGQLIGYSDIEYGWVDVIDSVGNYDFYFKDSNTIEMTALIISLPESDGDEEDFVPYILQVEDIIEKQVGTPHNRPIRSQSVPEKSHSKGTFSRLKDKFKQSLPHSQTSRQTEGESGRILPTSLQESATSLWNLASSTVKATASHLQQTLLHHVPLSETSESNLADLTESLDSIFTDADAAHITLLSQVWQVMFPGKPFERLSVTWKEAGWQGDNPATDLKSSGILALRALVYFGNKCPDISLARIEKNKANVKTNYPYAIVAVNLTLLLADLINLKDNKYFSEKAGYWGVFEDPTAFFEIFCMCFHHVDSIWTHRNAVRADFGKIIGETKQIVKQTLAKNPKTLLEFKFAAADEGMMVHDLYD